MARVTTDNTYIDGAFIEKGSKESDLPADVVSAIGDHLWAEEGHESASAATSVADPEPAAPEPTAPAATAGTAGTALDPPPLAGKGSSVEAWREYAASVGVQVGPDAKRDDVIDAIRSANQPVE